LGYVSRKYIFSLVVASFQSPLSWVNAPAALFRRKSILGSLIALQNVIAAHVQREGREAMKKKATPKSSRKRNAINDTNRTAQQHRLLKRLQKASINTLAARADLNILHPAARVQELKAKGHNIHTQRITIIDEYGRTHRGIALYTLLSLTREAA
jgi:hypothetical protein